MEKEFVPYDLALALKELGFDKPCFGFYYPNGKLINIVTTGFPDDKKDCVFAPLYQQCFKWFREKYDLKGFVSPIEYLDGTDDTYHWCIYNECNSGNDQLTYEEAELECLKKLIEIVKKKIIWKIFLKT